MSQWLIAVCGVIYLGVCIDQIQKGDVGMGITYFGYALGNVGLYIVAGKTGVA
jgi:hypothetical protein